MESATAGLVGAVIGGILATAGAFALELVKGDRERARRIGAVRAELQFYRERLRARLDELGPISDGAANQDEVLLAMGAAIAELFSGMRDPLSYSLESVGALRGSNAVEAVIDFHQMFAVFRGSAERMKHQIDRAETKGKPFDVAEVGHLVADLRRVLGLANRAVEVTTKAGQSLPPWATSQLGYDP